jgi:hypothetical protein
MLTQQLHLYSSDAPYELLLFRQLSATTSQPTKRDSSDEQRINVWAEIRIRAW